MLLVYLLSCRHVMYIPSTISQFGVGCISTKCSQTVCQSVHNPCSYLLNTNSMYSQQHYIIGKQSILKFSRLTLASFVCTGNSGKSKPSETSEIYMYVCGPKFLLYIPMYLPVTPHKSRLSQFQTNMPVQIIGFYLDGTLKFWKVIDRN